MSSSQAPFAPLLSFSDRLVATFRTFSTDLKTSALARAITVLLLHPLDATKSRLQVTTATSRVAIRAAQKGPLFAGLPAAVLGHVPYGILTFGLFGAAKKEISDRFPDMRRGAVTILSALLADAVGSIWLAPMEVIKLKLQTGVHGSFANALRSGGLYNGLLAQSLRDAPFRALNMLAYDTVREQMSRRMGRDVSGVEGITLGACVGGVVGAVTTPMDVVKTRVMSQRAGWGKCYGGWIGCAKKTIRGEGVAGLFRGVGCRTVYMAASVALFAVAYEQGRKWREEIKVAKRQ